MARVTEQKIKLLVLYDILQKQSDEQHPLTIEQLVTELEKSGITATRQTLYEDIDLLNKYGYEVIHVRGRNNKYFVGDRKFERPEIQVLLNAVGAAKFLTEKKTTVLTQKIAELLGVSQAEQLTESLAIDENKHSNERIYYSIDELTSALLNKKQVSFVYFDYGQNMEKLYRKDKERYIVNPLGLVYSGENFYLVCFHDKYKDVANYRIDRMEDVKEEKKNVTKLKKFENFNINEYKRSIFAMYSGEEAEVSLIFPKDLLNMAVDRFGEKIEPIRYGENEYIVKATVIVSKTFFAWLTTFEGRVKINAPNSIKEQYRVFVKMLLDRVE